ncbi:MAG: hypothetical protein IKU43_11125 [Clostridia bacterium]|nr:hypothetical protein [Clostridia bacterium]
MSLKTVFARNKGENKISGSGAKAKRRSLVSRVLLNYEGLENRLRGSAAYSLIALLRQKLFAITRAKHEIAKSAENSAVAQIYSMLTRRLINAPLRSFGVSAFVFGIFLLLVNSSRLMGGAMSSANDLYRQSTFGAVLVLVSLIMMLSRRSTGTLITESKILSFLLFEILPFDRKSFSVDTSTDHNGFFSVPAGLVMGLLSSIFNPVIVVAILFCIPLIGAVIITPEVGIIMTFLLLPFLSVPLLVSLTALCCVSVLFKVLRNKRVLKLSVFDISLLVFALLVLIGAARGVNAEEGMKSAAVLLLFMAFGFLFANTIKTTELTRKCITAIRLSLTVVSAIGILIFVLSTYSLERFHIAFGYAESVLRSIPFAADGSYAVPVALMLPFSFTSHKSDKGFGLVSLILCSAYAVLSFDMTVWACCAFAVVLYFCIKKPILFLYCGCFAGIVFLVNAFFPWVFGAVHSFVHRFSNHAFLQSVTPEANAMAVKAATEFMWSGAGTGDNVIGYIYTCLFGNGSNTGIGYVSYPVSVLLRFGIGGALALLAVLMTFASNCLSLYYTDKFCAESMRNHSIACISSVCGYLICETIFPTPLSVQLVLCLVLLLYIPVSVRRSSVNEFVPEAYELYVEE